MINYILFLCRVSLTISCKAITNTLYKYPVLFAGFIVTVQGFSYHAFSKANHKFDGVRRYNSIHNALGVEYNIENKRNAIRAGLMSFTNSTYTHSSLIHGSYLWKEPNRYFNAAYGLKYGTVTGYGEREISEYPINPGGRDPSPIIAPTYLIITEGYEIELLYVPTNLFIMLIKINL